jgi:23S rRNA pseudouridine1911/1915/1917 synthase
MAKNKDGRIYHVRADQEGETLASFLRVLDPKRTWGQVKQLVAARRVSVNGNLCQDPARRLREKDVVKLLRESANAPPTKEDVKIRYIDAHVVVVEKPAGITSNRHREEKHWNERRKSIQPTLDEMLPKVIAEHEGRGRRPDKSPMHYGHPRQPKLRKVYPVHRLDRETSGLMVFARTPQAEKNLIAQFRAHVTDRRYHAIVLGAVTAQTIESTLVRDRGDGLRGSSSAEDAKESGKHAVTHVRPLESLGDYSLVECRLETGRTHQIRIHLSEHGHPLCGDKVYRQPLGQKKIHDNSSAPRLALHSIELGFKHPFTDEELHFEMGLPADLARFLTKLRKATKQSTNP